MEDNQNFKFLQEAFKNAFKKFAAKYRQEDLTGRVVRAVATGGKAAVDRSLQEFPKTFISQIAKDFYGLLTSQEIADGISANVRYFDEEKIHDMLSSALAPLKDSTASVEMVRQIKLAMSDPETAIAQMEELMETRSPMEQMIFKMLLEKIKPQMEQIKSMSFNDFVDQIEGMVSMIPVPGVADIASLFFLQIRPILDGMKNGTDEEIAQNISELADMIPIDMISVLIANYTRSVTPESVSKKVNDRVGNLPSPQAVSDIVHGVADVVSQHLDRVSKIDEVAEIAAIMDGFAQNALDVVSETIRKDNIAKKTFIKKSGRFDI